MSVEQLQADMPASSLESPAAESVSKLEVIALVVSGLSLVVSFALSRIDVTIPSLFGLPLDPAWLAVIFCGVPIIKEAAEAMIESFDVKAGLLISLALIAAVAVGEIFAAGEVAFLMMLGEMLEERTVRRSRAGLDRLLNLQPKMARVVQDGVETMIPAAEVKAGHIVRVRPGETVPVDGVVLTGETAVDQSAVTGESVPVDLLPGDNVLSGGLNRFGAFEMKASRVGDDSSLARLIRLVEEADSKKAKLARTADRWATVIVPMAIVLAIAVGLVTGDVIRAVSILIVFCPCGLVLATPTAVVAAIGAATKKGVLIRSGEALERLGLVTHMAFDKTGTLTRGELKLGGIKSFGPADDELLSLAAAAESQSEHPLGQAVVRAAIKRELPVPTSEKFSMEPGLGVSAVLKGQNLWAGRRELMERKGLAIEPDMLRAENELLEAGETVVWLAADNKIMGITGLSDTIRPESAETVSAIKEAGLRVVLLTGDHEKAAGRVSAELGIDEVRAGLLPDEKVAAIKEFQAKGHMVAMAGDGLNDAPALKTASVGLAMGGIGSDVTIEAADVALLSGNLKAVPYLMKLSKRTLSTIKFNIAMAMGINLVAVVLAATGVMGPVLSALVHNLGAVAVVINATRLYHYQ